MEIEHFAKIFNNTGIASGYTRDDFNRALEKRAAETKSAFETKEQAYARVATQTIEGRELFKAAVNGPAPRQQPQDWVVADKKPMMSDTEAELDRRASEMSRREGISKERAAGRILGTSEGKELLRRLLAEEKIDQRRKTDEDGGRATADVRRQRDPIWDAQDALARDGRGDLGRSKGSARM
jgi:hypothetical protein